jgi:hypothetical protein
MLDGAILESQTAGIREYQVRTADLRRPCKLYAFTCGTVTGEFARLMEGGEGDITVPIPVFLIEHPKGRALFDTGLHPDCQHDCETALVDLSDLLPMRGSNDSLGRGSARRGGERSARSDRPRSTQD